MIMNKKVLSRIMLTCAVAVSNGSCEIVMRNPATIKHVKASILVLDKTGRPAEGEKLYVVEFIEFSGVVTEVLVTDGKGIVVLDREFCFPMGIYASGGMAKFNSSAAENVIHLQEPKMTLKQMFGVPLDEYSDFVRRHGNCG